MLNYQSFNRHPKWLVQIPATQNGFTFDFVLLSQHETSQSRFPDLEVFLHGFVFCSSFSPPFNVDSPAMLNESSRPAAINENIWLYETKNSELCNRWNFLQRTELCSRSFEVDWNRALLRKISEKSLFQNDRESRRIC